MTTERSTKKQRELLTFVDTFIKENGFGPSYREIMNGLGYKSVSTVAIHIDGLISKGYLRKRDNSARSLEVVSGEYGGGVIGAGGVVRVAGAGVGFAAGADGLGLTGGALGSASTGSGGALEGGSGIRPGTVSQGKWLRGAVEDRFTRYKQTSDAKLLDEIYVLIGALKILGFDEAYGEMRKLLVGVKRG